MQLFFADPYYDSENWKQDKYLYELKETLSDFDPALIAKSANIGHGADFPGVVVEIFNNVDWSILTSGAAAGLFFLGERINDNLDAWYAIFKKVKKLVEKLEPARIDEKAALALTLVLIQEKGFDLSAIELGLQVIPFAAGPCKSEMKLETQPDALYVVTIKARDKVFVFGIKSSGNVVFEHEFSALWHDF